MGEWVANLREGKDRETWSPISAVTLDEHYVNPFPLESRVLGKNENADTLSETARPEKWEWEKRWKSSTKAAE